MSSLQRNLHNRQWLLDALRAEIIGPDPPQRERAQMVTGPEALQFASWEEFRKPKIQPNGEEILWQDPPVKRYGAGVLFPCSTTESTELAEDSLLGQEASAEPDSSGDPPVVTDEGDTGPEIPSASKATPVEESENLDVTLANAFRPSALGLSFVADLQSEPSGLLIEVMAATYSKVKASVSRRNAEKPAERTLWYRKPCLAADGSRLAIPVPTDALLRKAGKTEYCVPGTPDPGLRVVVTSRPDPSGDPSTRLLTVCLVNRQVLDAGRLNELSYFQCGIAVRGQSGNAWLLPYPTVQLRPLDPLSEEATTRLLYRDLQTFAIGHGCAANWSVQEPEDGRACRATASWTESLPSFETPATTADLVDSSGNPIRVSMRKLAGLEPGDDGRHEIANLIEAYRQWIRDLQDLDHPRVVVPNVLRTAIPEDLKATAGLLLQRCAECLQRMEDGFRFLFEDSPTSRNALRAFRFANEAMLIAQLRSSREVRNPLWDADAGRLTWDRPIAEPDPSLVSHGRGHWRAFQIAFLLISLRGICEPGSPDRDLVDLIWFPTGGGKTEAYLGLTAFTVFFNRLAALQPAGADVIMRYTLRLLTAQQFQRAGLLFCAMEHVRARARVDLGDREFRLGMWVGGDATPNNRADARAALARLQRDPQHSENPFVLLKCPWCNARFGPIQSEHDRQPRPGQRRHGRQAAQAPITVSGYVRCFLDGRRVETVVFRCSDPLCEFGRRPLPIVVIDEDIYDSPPNLVIGTVDKFAMLAWKPEIRRVFGISEAGTHTGIPPSLIVQDELHLISGPLGSMVGAYETVIEELCTLRDEGQIVRRPKIVASTATISHAREQVAALYARPVVFLFPPPGLEANDSFFAREARNADGSPQPGRIYAGVMAPAHGSQQTTQARVFSTLLQFPAIMPVENGDETERDPWWTLVAFFNSLRELGGAATLLVADSRDYLRVILDRHGYGYDSIRQLLNCEELTSRVRSDQVPLAIQKLETPFQRDARGYVKDTVEVCLASNIIEVGVDIDRLGLMTVAGQPKTTSQYIQVTSRIGRSSAAPGLAVVTYSQSKPRDRSHYERFRTYHQRLYAHVEPTSVTPFSPPAVERALHGVLVAAVRQQSPGPLAQSPRPCPVVPGSALRGRLELLFRQRVLDVDAAELQTVCSRLTQRLNEWLTWDPASYGGFGTPPQSPPLMHPAGSQALVEWNGHSWPTLTSLRDVDATCDADITTYYNELQTGEELP